jgi:hypothetical protein
MKRNTEIRLIQTRLSLSFHLLELAAVGGNEAAAVFCSWKQMKAERQSTDLEI